MKVWETQKITSQYSDDVSCGTFLKILYQIGIIGLPILIGLLFDGLFLINKTEFINPVIAPFNFYNINVQGSSDVYNATNVQLNNNSSSATFIPHTQNLKKTQDFNNNKLKTLNQSIKLQNTDVNIVNLELPLNINNLTIPRIFFKDQIYLTINMNALSKIKMYLNLNLQQNQIIKSNQVYDFNNLKFDIDNGSPVSDLVISNQNVIKLSTTNLLSKYQQRSSNQSQAEIELVVNIPDRMKVNVEPSIMHQFRYSYITWFSIFIPISQILNWLIGQFQQQRIVDTQLKEEVEYN